MLTDKILVLGKVDLIKELEKLGLKKGMIVQVHATMKDLGYVSGGAQTIVDALMEIVTDEGTIVMPLDCVTNTEPSTWKKPKVKPNVIKELRSKMPAFDPLNSEVPQLGRIVNNFRRRKNIVYSFHPNCGYVAWGKYAKAICSYQSLNFAYSYESPAARLNELKAHVLLIGEDYDSITSIYLHEYYDDLIPLKLNCAMIKLNGRNEYIKMIDTDHSIMDYKKIGHIMEKNNLVSIRKINECECKLLELDKAIIISRNYNIKHSIINLYKKENL